MTRQLESAAFSVDFEGHLATSRLGQPADVGIRGNLVRSGRRHARGRTSLEMRIPDGGRITVAMAHVADGETLWTETSDPMTDSALVTRIPLAEASGSSTGLDIGQHGFDPLGMIEKLALSFDLELSERNDGRVTLEATLSGDEWARLRIEQGIPPRYRAEFDRLRLVLDEKTALPIEITLGQPEEPFLELRLSNLEPLDDLDPGMFAYDPPAGVEVRDLGTGAAGD